MFIGSKVESPSVSHLAIIMDGNGRWARSRFLPRIEGHRQGVKRVREIVEEAVRLGIRYLTLYTFSTENWKRPADEVSGLMTLFESHLKSELELFKKNGVRLRALGAVEALPKNVRALLHQNEEITAQNSRMDLLLAISYGGREEIVSAARGLAKKVQDGVIDPSEISEEVFKQHLYAPDVPDPDLCIRTSSEVRISNFLLWQLAYAELVISPVMWPEFTKEELHRCLEEFYKRGRRFGATDDQVRRSA